MSAYLVALIDIHDPEAYEAYAEAFDYASFEADYGGEILVVSDDPDVVEGEWTNRLVILKFPSLEKAHAWYASDEYKDVRTIRWAHSSSNLALHRGLDEPAA